MPRKRKNPVKAEEKLEPDGVESPVEDKCFLLALSDKNTSEDVPTIIGELLENREVNLVIEAGKVERIDTPFIEVLVATSKLWLSDGFSVEINNASEAFESCIKLLGISLSELEVREQKL